MRRKKELRASSDGRRNMLQERLTAGYLACMAGVYLLYPGLGGYANITEEKWRLFLLLTGGYIICSVLAYAELILIGERKPARISFSLPELFLLGYWLFSAVSTLLSVDRRVAFWGGARREGFVTITLYCIACLLVARYGKARRWLLYLFGVSMGLNCLLCFAQLAGLNPFGLYPMGMNYYDANKLYAGEFLGTIGNADVLSAVFCLSIPAFLCAAAMLRDKKRLLFLIPGSLCFGAAIGARVAGGFVGLLGCALLSVPVLLRGKAKKRTAAWCTAAVCVLGIVVLYFIGGRLGGTLYEVSELLHGRWNDSYGSSRLLIWRSVLPLVPERLLFGGGPDTLALRLDTCFEDWNESLGMVIRSSIDTAHNEYLGILVNEGLLALLCYLGMLANLAVKWFKRADSNPACAISGCAVLGYSIQAFFGIRSPVSAPFFYLALALLLKSESVENDREEKGK